MKSPKIKQAELTVRIGMAESTLSRFLRGDTDKLGNENIIRITRVFNVSTDSLLGEVCKFRYNVVITFYKIRRDSYFIELYFLQSFPVTKECHNFTEIIVGAMNVRPDCSKKVFTGFSILGCIGFVDTFPKIVIRRKGTGLIIGSKFPS